MIIMKGFFLPEEVVFMAKPQTNASITPTPAWQEWARKRAQHAPSLEHINEISKKVKISVTQLLIEERQGE